MTDHASSFIAAWKSGKESFPITTSGSTGSPKTILLRREQMIRSARKTARALKLEGGMNALVCLDTRYIAGIMMLVRSMEVGMNMIVVEPSANPLQNIPLNLKIDFVALVPYQAEHIIQAGYEAVLKDTTVIIGGASIPFGLQSRLSSMAGSIYATFGMTETISHVALQKLNGDDAQDHFHALDGVRFSKDERDCLAINTDYLEETIITNDIVELRSDTEFKWLGRYDHVINTGGVKVMPEKVETMVTRWMLTRGMNNRFFVSSLPHPTLGNEVVLVMETGVGKVDEGDLMDYLKAVVSKYELPKKFIYRTKFAETVTGKIDRKSSLMN